MAFKLAVIHRDPAGAVFAAAYGEATARDFPSQNHILFDTLLGHGWASLRVALDLDAVPYVDSSAIGWLIQAQKQFRDNGGRLVLHSVQPHVRNILNLLKIEKVVPIADDLASAQKALQEKSRRKQTA
jgi:anti-anti-sigma factor